MTSHPPLARRIQQLGTLGLCVSLGACALGIDDPSVPRAPAAPSYAAGGGGPSFVVDVSNDTTAQNETPLAVNPLDPANMITGNNDWNYNDGCGVNATFDGGRSWTRTLPNGFVPGITKYTNDPFVAGTGLYDYGGDPAVAFGPDGTAYFACFGYQGTPPYGVALLLSRSTDGGRTWTTGGAQPLTLVSAFNGDGHARGSTGQFPDHEAIHVATDGTIYVTWAQFNGYGSRSPVYVATSVDGGRSFSTPVKVTSGSVRSDQDQRIVTDPRTGVAYLTFDNSVQGGKGTAMFVSQSTDRGATWSAPVRFGTFENPVCLFPPYCFNISGSQFRGPGSYPAPAFDPTRRRLYVAYTDIVGGRAQILLTSASVSDLTRWTAPQVVAPGAGDRINVEMSIEPGSGRIDLMANDRSWTRNTLFDVTYLTSSDGGATWATQRVTKSGWDPSQYGVPDGAGIRPFIGDYDGIVSLPTTAGMTWTGPGRTYGALPTNLEVYFGSVTP
ncbi:putative neuraminidase (plasmid) [Gemmatirosa kalamazoonensis]|uniref:Putative neuraminidase n=1 Tax=Gemmatirosa kalamazoonensis TaxID=861299 RepID=W0RTZ8_9BACT|nr:sialidase family protein [Gemmatirosa kalamazoonensis]AHG93068.1 putative neuraminidase [Gemmatirosa kalamazoonensis]